MGTVKKKPLRQCLGCGQMRDKRELVRIIKTNEDEFILDATGKKNGRGAYVCPDSECIKKVIKTKALDRAFKMSVSGDVYSMLEGELKNYEAR